MWHHYDVNVDIYEMNKQWWLVYFMNRNIDTLIFIDILTILEKAVLGSFEPLYLISYASIRYEKVADTGIIQYPSNFPLVQQNTRHVIVQNDWNFQRYKAFAVNSSVPVKYVCNFRCVIFTYIQWLGP